VCPSHYITLLAEIPALLGWAPEPVWTVARDPVRHGGTGEINYGIANTGRTPKIKYFIISILIDHTVSPIIIHYH
jgi:hypothetical protein